MKNKKKHNRIWRTAHGTQRTVTASMALDIYQAAITVFTYMNTISSFQYIKPEVHKFLVHGELSNNNKCNHHTLANKKIDDFHCVLFEQNDNISLYLYTYQYSTSIVLVYISRKKKNKKTDKIKSSDQIIVLGHENRVFIHINSRNGTIDAQFIRYALIELFRTYICTIIVYVLFVPVHSTRPIFTRNDKNLADKKKIKRGKIARTENNTIGNIEVYTSIVKFQIGLQISI